MDTCEIFRKPQGGVERENSRIAKGNELASKERVFRLIADECGCPKNCFARVNKEAGSESEFDLKPVSDILLCCVSEVNFLNR